jgi:gamma-glutamyl-gamma-aminobutyrate hydrolase PuuD
MDGLLLSGGGDIEPARFGQADAGSTEIEPHRDALEAEAFATAEARDLPVLGICRGLQVINVFAGGTLLQHVDDHSGPGLGSGRPARTHRLRLVTGSRLAALVGDDAAGSPVNTFHHQAVRAVDLAPGFVATAWADSPAGPIVEALEAPGERFVVGVQFHPERVDSTPPAYEALWRAFVNACRERGVG